MKTIPIHGGKNAQVDDEAFDGLSAFKWHLSDSGYAVRADYSSGSLKIVRMHRQIFGAREGQLIDHRDGDRLNNQIANLRLCSRAENLMNQQPLRGTTSRFKGVYWLKANGKWRAKIKANGKCICLGLFTDEIEAAKAYDRAAILHFGDFARPNFVASRRKKCPL